MFVIAYMLAFRIKGIVFQPIFQKVEVSQFDGISIYVCSSITQIAWFDLIIVFSFKRDPSHLVPYYFRDLMQDFRDTGHGKTALYSFIAFKLLFEKPLFFRNKSLADFSKRADIYNLILQLMEDRLKCVLYIVYK